MQRLIYLLIIFILIGGIALTAYAPDQISAIFIIVMEVIIFLGVVTGILPAIQFYRGFESGLETIERALEVQTKSTWYVMVQNDQFFHQRTMDEIFRRYQQKVQSQRESGQILSDIEDYFNEDVLAMRSWQSVVTQIPGTLTGLGILGTFLGLIIGIRGISFSSVDAALVSVQTLLNGIQIAFYTSIAGVILSLVFNIIYRITWNVMLRNMGLFVDEFHKNVIPSASEQILYRERKEMKQLADLLERIPKTVGSAASGEAPGGQQKNGNTEQILMPQILQGLREGEFIFFLQPRYDINTKTIIGAEALVRWNHGKLGMVPPSVFLPILDSNGYITKLDQYIWEQVCMTIRSWIDRGIRPLPISINVSKTDLLALDVAEFFRDMLKKYRIPPRSLEIEISQTAYFQASQATAEAASALRAAGFRVLMDGFDGDFLMLETLEKIEADMLKLHLLKFKGNQDQNALSTVFEQARKMQFNLAADGIENMEQLGILRKCGCIEGQGFYLSKPISQEDFEALVTGEKAKNA